MVNLYICTTYYHVYITLLKQLLQLTPADLVICDDLATGQELSSRINSTGLFRNCWYVETKKFPEDFGRGKLDRILFQHKRRYRLLDPLLPFRVHEYENVYIYHDGTPLGLFLNDARKPYHLIEDSLNFYQFFRNTPQGKLMQPHNIKYWLRKVLNSGYFPLGESRFVLDIEVNNGRALQIPNQNVVVVPRADIEYKLSEECKRCLFKIFDLPEFSCEKTGKGYALILTEPLFRDGQLDSIESQMDIYKKVLNQIEAKGCIPVIKPHPRDSADYTVLKATMLNSYFPVELLALGSQCFEMVVSVSSSALTAIPANAYYFWDIKNDKLMIKTREKVIL